MNILTLDKALELYGILGDHIPEASKDADALEFIGKIIDNITKSNRHDDYIDAVILMSDKDWDELKLLDSAIILNMFIEGLSVNKIVKLKSFCDSIGFSNVS